jgi:hypothetical protein
MQLFALFEFRLLLIAIVQMRRQLIHFADKVFTNGFSGEFAFVSFVIQNSTRNRWIKIQRPPCVPIINCSV